MQYQNDHILMGENYIDEFSVEVTDTQKVRAIIANANVAG